MHTVPGIIPVNIDPQNQTKEKTLLVIGEARGGTSLAAGLLYHLGVPMGDQCDKPIYEDGILTRAIRSRKNRSILHTIAQYNAKWPIWGFKQPSVQKYLLRHHAKFRNPHFIFIVKDPASIAIRKNSLYDYEVIATMRKTLRTYDKILRFLRHRKIPALIISYDKLNSSYESMLPVVSQFTGIESAENDSVHRFFTDGKKDYQQFFNNQLRRREHGIEGHIDQITDTTVCGWALHRGGNQSVEVYLQLNNIKIGKTVANLHRPDLKKAGLHPTGNCGYEFHLSPDAPPVRGDMIQAFAGKDRVELSRSPWEVR